ncbi:MAG: hypothetical protein ACYCZW_01175 [Minisyncoccota bacterium]
MAYVCIIEYRRFSNVKDYLLVHGTFDVGGLWKRPSGQSPDRQQRKGG